MLVSVLGMATRPGGRNIEQFMRQLEARLLMPEIQMISFRMQRTVLLYILQLNLLASKVGGISLVK